MFDENKRDGYHARKSVRKLWTSLGFERKGYITAVRAPHQPARETCTLYEMQYEGIRAPEGGGTCGWEP